MSADQHSFAGGGKKAVHVKWSGKTIALGTFPAQEADEKCARAKALTRVWRSTMKPKPSRDWVMVELERLGVRVVSGRLGRKAGEEGEETMAGAGGGGGGGAGDSKPDMSTGVAGMQMNAGGTLATSSGLTADGVNNGMGWGSGDTDLGNMAAARRSSSLGLSMMSDNGRRGSMSSLGPLVGMDSGEPLMPPHRKFVGGGAAAAFEAKRFDHYAEKAAERRNSSLGLGSLTGSGLGNIGMSVNPNQHYEMLKLHHMNLLNEIQETTLMMNLYQQQQLQQQQQELQRQHLGNDQLGTDPQVAMLLQQQGLGANLDTMFGACQADQQTRASLGLGGNQMNGNGNFSAQQQLQFLQQQQQLQLQQEQQQQQQTQSQLLGTSMIAEAMAQVNGSSNDTSGSISQERSGHLMENRLNGDSVVKREEDQQRMGEEVASGFEQKRAASNDFGNEHPSQKRQKTDSAVKEEEDATKQNDGDDDDEDEDDDDDEENEEIGV